MSNDAFSETLQFITTVKLNELNKRNDKFVEHASQVTKDASEHAGIDPVTRLELLVKGLDAWPNTQHNNFSCTDTLRYLEQARRDPGFPPSVIEEWIRQAEAQFGFESTRFEFARLFGVLLNEWLHSKSSSSQDPSKGTGDDSKHDQDSSGEHPERKETNEQKEKLEALIFETKEIDVAALEEYLNGLFTTKTAKEQLESIRSRIKSFGQSLAERKITIEELKKVISSVLQADVLSDKKQVTLKEFLRNQIVMEELADVLNMQLSTLKSWSWPADGVALEPRRHVNGRVRFCLDAEILTCLLLHFLGMLWSVEFKSALKQLLYSAVWSHTPNKMAGVDRQRRDRFYGRDGFSVDKFRHQLYADHFFMCQLPSEFEESTDHYADDTDERRRANNVPPYAKPNSGLRFDSPVDLKQSLLHILSVDVAFKKELYGQCAVVRTDLEWFGPSLPFATVTTILRFFGVPEENIEFMQAFLSCPVTYKDDPSKPVRVRKRGVPITYRFSTLFGELIMFIMDFAVNQRVDGLLLHRIHDDFWFWDADSERCATAWAEMRRYAEVAGLNFNREKTGSAVIGGNAMHSGLPDGDIRWGFLQMDPLQNGRFLIDEEMINKHIKEMRRQLAATTSVFGWIQAYNKYIAFMVRNCGHPAIIWGREHVDSIIDTIAHVQRSLFSSEVDVASQGSFTIAVSKTIEDKFHVSTKDVPYGWYLWPNAAGGLEIKDVLIDLFLVRDGYRAKSVDSIFRKAYQRDESEYDMAKRRWESSDSNDRMAKVSRLSSHTVRGELPVVDADDPFLSFEEFTKAREECGDWWYTAYKELLERPAACSIVRTPKLEASLKLLGDSASAFSGSGNNATSGWSSLRPYWQWVIALHHDEMVKKFGGLAVVEPTSIPVGMVSVFKGSRMKWEQ
ncbi:uncharacterized protein FOMMEDRAFT_127959 [Fomitiporia mediterranea MF3/22]|uniref:uncharacterized protein n=1 Tax=Fomitiporia mediterranea (strain MF3/22) TaxID=694068 RepID=UPI0004409006|nr:uncharacterized protein FOMMEDRAFT_127959 [Fomitiporia mediterranea MF3/22]EJC99768.1 hypothetical protein FOMMEDRAFT_127959 [Fomitiporia mediterranea MF3/22]